MPRLAFIGYGELGRQIDALVSPPGASCEKLFFDDGCAAEGLPGALPFARHADEEFADARFYVCLGYKHLVRKTEIVLRLLELSRELPSFIHSTCHVSPSANIAKGSVLYPMCNVDKDVTIGYGVLLNNSVVVSHNTTIGDGCYLSPGAIVSGFVHMGRNTFVGSRAVISNDLIIGEHAIIGIGTVVTKEVPDGCSAIGNPMRFLNHRLRLE